MAHRDSPTQKFSDCLTTLVSSLHAIERDLSLDPRGNPEDQLKAPISRFLEDAGTTVASTLHVTTEHRQVAGDVVEGVRLDLAIKRGRGLLTGHIELKSPGKSANPYRKSAWTKHDRTQWKKLERHPNLVYSNGWEWTLLRHGVGQPLAHVILTPASDGSVPSEQVHQLKQLLTQFLNWKPLPPSTPKALAGQLAPLTAFLRDSVLDVLVSLPESSTGLPALYQKWQLDLMPGATHRAFADSFAQTFTYALLLARIESDQDDESFQASSVSGALLRNGHKLIGSVLQLMSQPANRELVEGPVGLLESVIGAVNPTKLSASTDPWLYFYEDFLAAYDPQMRKDAGVYYTPVEIVQMQVRLLDDILRTRFGRQHGFGSDDVNLLDPAAGTGAYPLAVIESVLGKTRAPQDDARSLSKRLFAFELLVGPYAVAHLRLTQMLEQTGIDLGEEGVQVYLTNTLTDPGDVSANGQQISIWEIEQNLNEETRQAGLIKNQHTKIQVILGNPPYDRGSKQKALGEGSEAYRNIVLQEVDGNPPLLDAFIDPLTAIGAGGQAKNLYNSYVYFVRWAIWKACEQHRDEAGMVSFITSSSYLRGPGFAGMREYMRRVFDEIWVIDLGGQGLGARKDENVFSIQTPVAIFFGVQWEKGPSGRPRRHGDRMRAKAQVNYQRVQGTRREKLDFLSSVNAPEADSNWQVLKDGDWHAKFVPDSAAGLAEFAPLDWIFPWSHSGVQFKRKWPIGATTAALLDRWTALSSDEESRSMNFRETSQKRLTGSGEHVLTRKPLPPLSEDLSGVAPVRYGYRSFDRQYALPDSRLCDRPRPPLWDSYSDQQLYFATLSSTALGRGPALTVSPYVPDLHYFRGSFGGKDSFPLHRSRDLDDPNVSKTLLQILNEEYGNEVSAEDVALYTFGLLGTGAYTERFEVELVESLPRVPMTSSYEVFQEVLAFGRSLVFEQTWGERCGALNAFGQSTGQRFEGEARIESETAPSPYPESWSYDAEERKLSIGSGLFTKVSPEVMNFSVSGMEVVGSWLGYRMLKPAGTSSSPLDQVQAESWHLDRELLELLWQVEYFVLAETEGARLLETVITGRLIEVKRLGPPTDEEVQAPKRKASAQIEAF